MKVAIVGGGASGVLCAILIKMNRPDIVLDLYEQNDRLMKKLLQTGNGMCNLDNVNSNDYKNYNTELISNVVSKYDFTVVTKIFKQLGLITMIDNEGRCYPHSRKANSVVDVLLANLNLNGVNINVNTLVMSINQYSNQFVINMNKNYDVVVMATGGCAGINYFYNTKMLAKEFGFGWKKETPSLVALKVRENVKGLSGIRVKAKVKYYTKLVGQDLKYYELVEERSGEVLFKDEGLSGIVIYEISRKLNVGRSNKIVLDLFEEYTIDDLQKIIEANYHKFINPIDALIGIVPKMISYDIAKRCNNDVRKFANCLKNYEFIILNTYDFDQAQVMRGGIDLDNIDINTFEAKEIKNLYCIGEALNVDGTCGGYNLHFAWASAISAADAIVRRK